MKKRVAAPVFVGLCAALACLFACTPCKNIEATDKKPRKPATEYVTLEWSRPNRVYGAFVYLQVYYSVQPTDDPEAKFSANYFDDEVQIAKEAAKAIHKELRLNATAERKCVVIDNLRPDAKVRVREMNKDYEEVTASGVYLGGGVHVKLVSACPDLTPAAHNKS